MTIPNTDTAHQSNGDPYAPKVVAAAPPPTLFLTAAQVAALAGVNVATVRRAITRGELLDTAVPGVNAAGQPRSRTEAKIPFADAQAYAHRISREREMQEDRKAEKARAKEARAAARAALAAAKADTSTLLTLRERVATLETTLAMLQDTMKHLTAVAGSNLRTVKLIATHVGLLSEQPAETLQ
jgi:hypothetical protein